MTLQNTTPPSERRPKVVSISYPKWAGEDYMKAFERDFELHHIVPSDRAGTVAALKAKVESDGPFEAIAVLMGTGPYEPFDEEMLKPLLPQCKLVVSASAGYDDYDVEWMTEHNIVFCNSRNAVNESTADLTIFLTLGILRDYSRLQISMREGRWRGGLAPVRDPAGLTLGIVGMGAIGKHVARKAAAFNLKIAYYQRNRLSAEIEAQLNAKYCDSLTELLSTADIVSLNCPLDSNTRGLIGKAELASMKDGVFIVNTSRGAIIDEDALVEALESGKVARAGMDVFVGEPKPNAYFLNSDRVMIQPHMGGITDMAWQKAYREALENMRAFFTTGKAISPINADLVKGS
ncbi:hypothetical protein LTR56_002994 [Elasticomyces elasticus]|nr:hypothetical protein LTR56_002994 [Elasticomyces elasticus]KAK3662057.1 hypothetical protein LTR22_007029 [Elasticomyces elasticus]KAK5753206.1 hypothetical protein LTS12_016673 [Elasticomyces elasticus]